MPKNIFLEIRVLKRDFFKNDTIWVARKLLGKVLVRRRANQMLAGRIMETEAYHGADDLACHASRGKTSRTKVMFGKPGRIYVYLIYGKYYCLNIVTMKTDFPAAVLIRSIEPIEGIEKMIINRGKEKNNFSDKKKIIGLSNGPGKLCQALQVDKSLNGKELNKMNGLWVKDDGFLVKEANIIASKRIGVDYARHCRDWEWNFSLSNK